jgi:hypothetical protein
MARLSVLSLAAAFAVVSAADTLSVPTPAPLPGLLRPQASETRQMVDLSGIWDFRAEGYSGQGVADSWYAGSFAKKQQTQLQSHNFSQVHQESTRQWSCAAYARSVFIQ